MKMTLLQECNIALILSTGTINEATHYTASFHCCKKHSTSTTTKLRSLKLLIVKISSTVYVILFEFIDLWVLDSNSRVGVWSLLWRWHILSILLKTGGGISAKTCGLDDVFPPDDLCSRPETLCQYIDLSIRMCSVKGRIYTYTNSVVQYWWSCTPSQFIGLFWGCAVPVLNATFCFLWFTKCFCPYTFFQNIGFNMVSSDPFVSHLATQLGYSAGEFQAL